MKLLNERTIATWLRSSPVDKEGVLYKRGNEYSRAFKKRYFVLCSNILSYYSSIPQTHQADGADSYAGSKPIVDSKPLGIIFLEGQTVELAEESGDLSVFILSFPSSIQENGESRKYILGAATPEAAEQWSKALMNAGTDYLSCTNTELGEQLNKLTMSVDTTLTKKSGDKAKKKPAKPELRFNPFDSTQQRSRANSSLLSAQLDAQMFGDTSNCNTGSVFFPVSSAQFVKPELPDFEELRQMYSEDVARAAQAHREK